jgi:hypothetical protein
MPFNSSVNNFHQVHHGAYRHDYDYLEDNLQALSVPELKFKPNRAEVRTTIIDPSTPEHSVNVYEGGSKIGRFFKKVGKDIQKTSYALDRATRPIQQQVVSVSKVVDRATKPIQTEIRDVSYEVDRATRPAQKAIARSTINKNGLIHNLISATADVVLPQLGTVLGGLAGTAATGNPIGGVVGAKAGNMTGQIIRKTLKSQTGYGLNTNNKKSSTDVKLDKIIKKYVPDYAGDVKTVSVSDAKVVKSKVKKPMSGRNVLVKKIMNEQNLSLPEASKYIKANNLY